MKQPYKSTNAYKKKKIPFDKTGKLNRDSKSNKDFIEKSFSSKNKNPFKKQHSSENNTIKLKHLDITKQIIRLKDLSVSISKNTTNVYSRICLTRFLGGFGGDDFEYDVCFEKKSGDMGVALDFLGSIRIFGGF
ncbi:hypothetical protein BpHYR1_025750 [Brachionus plicatilis]|uniref:Uncharacterized protein n=1 Tax=Brachionus plicatilis TaxID=10195 RepID=A0A3M7RNE4_BRAPC|nr:hypothetical protein BpHYR1_025750 [Brachionus plicatilis]